MARECWCTSSYSDDSIITDWIMLSIHYIDHKIDNIYNSI